MTGSLTTVARFDSARPAPIGLPGGAGINIAHEIVDRHVDRGWGGRCALRCIDRDGATWAVTYGALADRTNRFANALDQLGVRAGDRVALLLERTADLHVAAIGTWKHRSVACPLFPVFGPEPVRQRLALAEARVLVTSPQLYEHRVAPIRDQLPALHDILMVGATAAQASAVPGGRSLDEVLACAGADYTIGPTDPEDLATLHFTSGTTGPPKAAMHVHGAVAMHYRTGAVALGLREGDVFWCTADPAWVTGTAYGIIAPLSHGATVVVVERGFDVDRWYRVLEEHQVTIWYTTPTALRMLQRAGAEAVGHHDLSALRVIASVGEPLDADTVRWSDDVWHRPVHDSWWQTETGGIMIANWADEPVVPGSMGRPLPGVQASVLARDEARDGEPLVRDGVAVEAEVGTVGHLAFRPDSPSMFRGYLGEPGRSRACFVGGWYVSGDLARRDAEGCYWFVGRVDEVIEPTRSSEPTR